MILHCNYEELQALRAGAHNVLEPHPQGPSVPMTEARRSGVEALLPQLEGDMSFHTLAEQRRVEASVGAIVESLKLEMDAHVVATHPAHEAAVAAYFDYAHALAVHGRLREVGRQMEAMIEVVAGGRPDDSLVREFVFPD